LCWVVFCCRESWWGYCPLIMFSHIYFTFVMIYASRLRFDEPFLPMWSSVFVLCCCFFSRCQYYMNYWTHPPFNCWQIYPTTEYIEMAKQNIPYQLHWITYFCEMWSEEFIYRAFNWSVKKMLMNRDEDPSPFFLTSKVEEWLMITCVLENCSLDLFVVLDLDLGSILIDNYVFLSLKSWK
jgi:hypothetical protein